MTNEFFKCQFTRLATKEEKMSRLADILARLTTDGKVYTKHKFDLADALSAYMEAHDLDTTEMAKRLNVSKTTLLDWLSASVNLTIRTIAKIEATLDTKLMTISYQPDAKHDDC